MKKILFAITLAAAATTINAQLVVDSLGHVGIGTLTPWSLPLLSVGSHQSVNLETGIQCSVRGKRYGVYFLNHTDVDYEVYGMYSNTRNVSSTSVGGRAEGWGNNNAASTHRAIGMIGAAGEAHTAAGILGRKVSTSTVGVNYAGVYGTENSSNTLPFGNYSGSYAGFFYGKARVTDGIYATLLSPVASPSFSEQNGTTMLSVRGESVTDKLSQVQAVQFLRQGLELTEDEETREKEEGVKQESHLSAVQYGLDAEQLKAVYPELVYEDAQGNVSINYVEMVPLLVQSINELKAELAEMKGASAKKAKAKAETTGIEATTSDIDMVRMDQNKPNPFSESTVISLNIPSETQSATIFIYDMSGKQVQSLPVTERGKTDITVYAHDLTAGMYIYTLVVDGKVAMTRRMIVSE